MTPTELEKIINDAFNQKRKGFWKLRQKYH